jgi:hypothetical protein
LEEDLSEEEEEAVKDAYRALHVSEKVGFSIDPRMTKNH